jgi:hypothetical protein
MNHYFNIFLFNYYKFERKSKFDLSSIHKNNHIVVIILLKQKQEFINKSIEKIFVYRASKN